MTPKEKEKLIKKHLGINTPNWIVQNCIKMLNDFEDVALTIPDVVKSLPTDRAIDQAAFESSYGYSDTNYNSFKEGVKWVIEQLKTFNTKER